MKITELIKVAMSSDGGNKIVLDLGCGQGRYSNLCLELGGDVTAVDDLSSSVFVPGEEFLKNSRIEFIEKDISLFMKENKKKFDIILLFNVLPFLGNNFIKNELEPFCESYLNNGGKLLFSYFTEDDDMFSAENSTLTSYDMTFFTSLEGLEMEYIKEFTKTDSHPPLGEHIHYMGVGILRKIF